jgi:hypothetical protein
VVAQLSQGKALRWLNTKVKMNLSELKEGSANTVAANTPTTLE